MIVLPYRACVRMRKKRSALYQKKRGEIRRQGASKPLNFKFYDLLYIYKLRILMLIFHPFFFYLGASLKKRGCLDGPLHIRASNILINTEQRHTFFHIFWVHTCTYVLHLRLYHSSILAGEKDPDEEGLDRLFISRS